MSGVSIKYGNVAPEAKENFVPTATDVLPFVELAELQQYNLTFPNFTNPCDEYSMVLDGKALFLPSDTKTANLGLWSEQISNADGRFAEPIVLRLKANGQYSSAGLTLNFDQVNNIFPTEINVQWLRNGEVLNDADFYPNSSSFFCDLEVQNYDEVVITFLALNMPLNRLKLHSMDYGYGTIFYGGELRNAKVIQEIDPISTEISINTVDFTLESKTNRNYDFQMRQPLSVEFDGQLIATAFVKKAVRKGEKRWDIQAEDYIGLMDSVSFTGGMYSNADAVVLLKDIFAAAKVPYMIAEELNGKTLTGYLPILTCREALMQVAFAIGAVVDTSFSDKVNVFKLKDKITQTVPKSRIMQGQKFTDNDTVTSVEVTAHSYAVNDESLIAYESANSGVGENIYVTFNEPLHSLEVANGDILQSGVNFAVINARQNCVLQGKKYLHTTTTKKKINPLVLASEPENIIKVETATLLSASNIDEIANICYNYFVKRNYTNMRIVEGKHEFFSSGAKYGAFKYGTNKYGANGAEAKSVIVRDKAVKVGDKFSAETDYLGIVTGYAVKQTFNLNGGILIKDTEMR